MVTDNSNFIVDCLFDKVKFKFRYNRQFRTVAKGGTVLNPRPTCCLTCLNHQISSPGEVLSLSIDLFHTCISSKVVPEWHFQ